MSPVAQPRFARADIEDNPYELRSLSRTLQQPVSTSDELPHHARIGINQSKIDMGERQVLSPSIYSRNSDGASPRPDTPVEQSGMIITITGREVRSYSISPQKRDARSEKPVQASNEWRRWLSNEMSGWGGGADSKEFMLPKTVIQETGTSAVDVHSHLTERPQSFGVREESTASASPPLTAPQLDAKQKQPRPRRSRSSFMNERYPMIDSGRQTSDTRKASSRANSRPASIEADQQLSTYSGNNVRKSVIQDTGPSSVVHRPRPVSKHQSIGELKVFNTSQRTENEGSAGYDKKISSAADTGLSRPGIRDAAQQEADRKKSNRTKSAFDLRANYKNRSTGQVRSIAVNRQNSDSPHQYAASSPVHILDDTTIQNISAGPYACQPRNTSTALASDANKENSPPALPPSEASSLPALSSSEWLAAGSSKSRNRKTSIHPALRTRSVSRYSPSRTGSGLGNASPSGGSSPGQRMVTSWLDGKKSKENSPAFV
jgi:hypothetical protein